jgi:hypothetical protein
VTAAELLASKGRNAEAHRLLNQRLNTLITPIEVLIAARRAQLEETLGRPRDAYQSYKRVVDAWSEGDPVLQPYVEKARREMAKLQPRIANL